MNENKSARYQRLQRRAAVASVCVSAGVPALLLVSGGAHALDDAVSGLSRVWPFRTGSYVVAFLMLHELAVLPLVYYRGYRLERRYGLSSETLARWFRDHLKGVLLSALVLSGAAVVLYGLLRLWPTWWWLAAAAVYTLLTAALTRLFPTLLLPWFYRFKPLDRPELMNRLHALFRKAGVPVVGVFEWGLGSKSRTANAAVVGLGGSRRILLSDTMLAEYSDDEIEVVLAHELAHHVHGDIRQALLVEGLLLIAATGAIHLALLRLGPAIGLSGATDLAGLPLVALVGGAVFLLATPLVLALSRANERRADDFALRLTGHSAAFVSAMRRLAAQNLAETEPPRIALWLFHSHPPVQERIDRADLNRRIPNP